MASINYSAKALTVDDIENAIKELQDLKKTKEREAREAEEKLPSDARRKVLIGVAVLEARKRGFISEDFLNEVLDKFLTKNKDRAVFDLTPREMEGDKQRGRPKKEQTADTPPQDTEATSAVTETNDSAEATEAVTEETDTVSPQHVTKTAAGKSKSRATSKQGEWDKF